MAGQLQRVWFHDNFALENPTNGFIIDSLDNDGVIFEFNEVIHPGRWGIIIGGGGEYSRFRISDNLMELGNDSAVAFVVQPHVTNSAIVRNLLVLDKNAGKAREVWMKGSGTHDLQIRNKVLRATACDNGHCWP